MYFIVLIKGLQIKPSKSGYLVWISCDNVAVSDF